MKFILPSLRRLALATLGCTILAGPALAAQIDCPLSQVRREITTQLPNGWWNTPMVSRLSDTRVIQIAGRPALQCVYGTAGRIQRNAPDGQTCTVNARGFTCVIIPELFGKFFMQQKSTQRFMDAHEGSHDNSAVTRNFQGNRTQKWIFKSLGNNVYTIQQHSNGRYLDAHEGINDNNVVTRNSQNNATQQWIVKRVGTKAYTIQQHSNGRYLDAHEAGNDHSIVTRDQQGNTTQVWILQRAD
jgi:hypothetical protein